MKGLIGIKSGQTKKTAPAKREEGFGKAPRGSTRNIGGRSPEIILFRAQKCQKPALVAGFTITGSIPIPAQMLSCAAYWTWEVGRFSASHSRYPIYS
jgi:hypothetical protein